MTAERNELLEIWNQWWRKECYETRRDMKKSGRKTNKHLIRYIVYRDNPTFIQYFWTLKAKIDDLKKQNLKLEKSVKYYLDAIKYDVD